MAAFASRVLADERRIQIRSSSGAEVGKGSPFLACFRRYGEPSRLPRMTKDRRP